MNRRIFVRNSAVAAGVAALGARAASAAANAAASTNAPRLAPAARRALSEVGEFTFARLRYASGNWDADPLMPANLLHSLTAHTGVRTPAEERIVDANSGELTRYPFVYLTGNKAVRFSETERGNLRRYLRGGGFMFVDDCEHDVAGPFARTFEGELRRILDRPDEALRDLPNTHPLYRSFFEFPEGPPATSHELNGWGDQIVHDTLRAVEINGRIAVLYSNKDYGCEWDYDPANKRFAAPENTYSDINITVYPLSH